MIDKVVESVDDAATPANDKSNSSNIMLVDSN
jgi:hypothetical protein